MEPVAVLYRWYGWYLLAYHPGKRAYRTYKLARMREVRTGAPFAREHGPAEEVLAPGRSDDSRRYTEVLVKCGREAAVRAGEYLKGEGIERYPDGSVLLKLRVVENEQLCWGCCCPWGIRWRWCRRSASAGGWGRRPKKLPPSTGNATIPLSYIPYYTGEKRKGIYKMKKSWGLPGAGWGLLPVQRKRPLRRLRFRDCPGAGNCENRACAISRGLRHCYECPECGNCRKGKLSDPRIYGFTHFARVYGENCCLPASPATRKQGSATTGRALKGITTAFRTPGRWRGLSGAGKVHKGSPFRQLLFIQKTDQQKRTALHELSF